MRNGIRSWKLRLGVAVLGLVAVAGGTVMANGEVGAQQAAERVVEGRIDVNQGPPGSIVNVSGRCLWESGSPAEMANVWMYTLTGVPIDAWKKTSIGNDGSWSMQFPIPLEMPVGPARISFTCFSGDAAMGPLPGQVDEYDFLVTEGGPVQPPVSDPPPLPDTPVVRPRSGTPRFTG